MKKIFTLFLSISNLLMALPQELEVASGEVFIHQEDFQTMVITASDKAIVNYKQFNVEVAEKIQFIQPSSTSTVLNRVIGSNPSQILGNITANGKVFLINPHGVYFGKEATVDTGSLVVSTLDILDQDFLEDRFSFRAKENTSGFIHNEGSLIASDIALISSDIKNEGTICALLNKVVLASSEAITLTFSNDRLMSFEIEDGVKEGIIEHLGSIEAHEVFIHVAQVKETFQNVINVEGLIDGNTITQENGKIRIVHQSSIKADNAYIESSQVAVDGKIDVSNKTSKSIGGILHILGDHIELRGAAIDASGDSGGGTVLIGGEYKGQGDLRTALTNFMDENSLIKANAYNEGGGGRVILWAEGTTVFHGKIFAKGGEISGNGGFVETSGKETLSVTGYVNTLAPNGKAGDWLLDPTTITIAAGGLGTLAQAADCTNVSTAVTIAPATINAAASNIILCASVSITQNASQTISLASGIGITFQGTGGTISTTLNGNVFTRGGFINFTNTTVILGAPVQMDTTLSGSSGGGNITFDSTATIDGATTLNLSVGGSIVSFGAAIGATTPITGLAFASGARVDFGASLTCTGLNVAIPMNLTNSISFTSNNGNISFSSTLDGAKDFTLVAGTGTVLFSGVVGGITPLTNLIFTSASQIRLSSVLTVSGTNPLIFSQPTVLLTTSPTVISNNANIIFSNTIFSNLSTLSLTLDAGTGSVTFSGTVGPGGTFRNVIFTNTSSISIGANMLFTGTTAQTFPFPVFLAAGVSIANGGSNISFTSTIDGARALTLVAGIGTITLSGVVGGTTPLLNLIFTSAASIQLGADITVSGANPLTFGQAVSLIGPSTITSNNAAITFSSTINGAQNLSLQAGTATITLSGTIGGVTALGSFTATTTNATATAIRTTGNIKTSGVITMTGIVSLTGTGTMDSTNGGGSSGANISFSSTVNGTAAGTQGLTVTGGIGTVTFTGAIGATTTLLNLSATSATIAQTSTAQTTGALSYTGSTAINLQGNITTSGGIITMTGPVTLTNAYTFDSTNAGGTAAGANINFSGSTTSVNFSTANTLTLRAGTAGVISFGGAVGGSTPPTNITFTSASSVQIGGNITVSGANPLVFPQAVVMTGTSTVTSNNANINFNSTLNGAGALTIAGGSGTLTFTGAIGATTALASLSATSATITQPLTAKTTGALSYTGSTSISLQGNITTSGGIITMTGPVTLTNAYTFDSTNAGGTAAGANINFSGSTTTVNFSTANTLTLRAGTGGIISFGGAVGGSTPPTNITFTSASAIQIGANITVSGANPLLFPQAVVMTGTSNLTSNNANISFSSTLNGAQALTLTAGTGTVSFSAAVGGITPLANIIFASSSGINIGANIAVSGANPLVFGQAVNLTGPSTITANNANVTFSSTLNGTQAFTISAGTGTLTFTGAIGATTALTSLSGSGSTVTQSSTAKTTGVLSYTGSTAISLQGNITTSGGVITMTGPVILTNAYTFDSTNAGGTAVGANINFSGSTTTVNFSIANTLTLRAGTGGIISFGGAVGGSTPPTNIIFTSASAIQIGANITVSGANPLLFPQAVVMTGTSNLTSNNANISFSSTLDGAQALTLTAGTGTVTFSAAVGGTTPLANIIFASSSGINVAANITVSGANPLVFGQAVNLTGPSTITANNANVTFSSSLNGAQAFTISAGTGTLTFTGAVGATTALTSLSGSGSTVTQSSTAKTTGALSYAGSTAINVQGNITTSGGVIMMTGPVVLTNALTFDSTNAGGTAAGANINFSGSTTTVNFATANTLTLRAGTAGVISFEGAVGGSTPPTNIIFTSASAIQIGANITVSGANPLVFPQAVVMTGSSTITSNNANINFNSTLDGAQSLTVAGGTGAVTFTTAVGSTTPLTSLSVISAIILQSSTLTVSGAVTYTNSGLATIVGAVSVGSFTQNGGGTVLLETNMNATSTISFTDPVTFNASLALTAPSGITFGTMIPTADGVYNLTLSAVSGSITATQLGSPSEYINVLTMTAFSLSTPLIYANNVIINGSTMIASNITAPGAQLDFTGPVTVAAGTFIIDVTGGVSAGSITFDSTLDGPGGLNFIVGTGDLTFTGFVGGIVPFGHATVTSAQNVTVSQNFTGSSFTQTAGSGTTTIAGTMTTTTVTGISLTGNIFNIAGPIITSNSGTVTFDNSGLLTLASPISSNGPVSQIGGGSVDFESSITTTNGAVDLASVEFTSPIDLKAAVTINTSIGGGNITFGSLSTINGAEDFSFALGAGIVTFNSAIGGITPLTNLVFVSAGLIEIGSTITVSGSNPLVFSEPVSLMTASVITSNNADITFSSTLDGSHSLTLLGGTGTTTFSGAVGSDRSLRNLTVIADVITQSSTMTASGTITYTNTGLATISGTVSAGVFIQNGGGTVLLEASVLTMSSILFTNAISFDTSIFMVAPGPGGITLQSPIIPTSSGVYDLSLSARAGGITAVQLGSPLEYINTLTLSAKSLSVGSIYANTIIDNGTETINSNITAPGAYLLFPRPTTVAAGNFTIDISGGNHTGAVRFYSTLDGPGGLTFIIGSGNLGFDGSVGGIVPFGDVTITSAQNVRVSNDFTGSSFVQTAVVGTTTIAGTMKTSSSTGISLEGNLFNITGPMITTAAGPVSFNNTGFLTLSSSVTSNGPVSQTGGGAVLLGGTIMTTNPLAASASISFTDPIALTDAVVMNTSIGGGDITFGSSSTINGLQNLSFIAGSGDISLSGEVGGLTPVNFLSIYSADNITLPAITGTSLLQASGTGTTTIEGLITITGDSGVVLVGNIFDINASIETFGVGSVIVQNSGQFTLNMGAEIDAAGAFLQTGTGGAGLYGNIESE